MIESQSFNTSFDIAIMGAGCAGMSLAYRLMLCGYQGTVAILEKNDTFAREQRWCSWGPIEPKIMPFVSQAWQQFLVIGPACQLRLPATDTYYQVSASEFLDGIVRELSDAGNFKLFAPCTVFNVTHYECDDLWSITTDHGPLSAKLLFDARNIVASSDEERTEPWLWQSFAGSTVSSKRDIFDPGAITLMDFDVPGGQQGAFVYVLPYSPRTALVESTLVSSRISSQNQHMERVQWYIDNKLGGGSLINSIEVGAIPMTAKKFPFEIAKRHYAIGVQSGAAKPSTGYAFSRIQAQTQQIAEDIIKFGEPQPTKPSPAEQRRQWLDDVFITASRSNEEFFSRTVLRMFEKLPTNLLIRFLSERDTVADSLKVMNAVGSLELAASAAAVGRRR